MDSVIAAAARALALGDPLAALKRIALRDDAPALALRGTAMAQLGDLARARKLLRSAARGFGRKDPLARARCLLAEAEIAFVARDLGGLLESLGEARTTLAKLGDRTNAAHAGSLEARRLLLVGRVDDAERTLDELDSGALARTTRVSCDLVVAGIAIRRLQTARAESALVRAERAARAAGIEALIAEVDRAAQSLASPAARLIDRRGERSLKLQQVEALVNSGAFVVDACRNVVRAGPTSIPFASRPVLFALVRTLAEAWPDDATRETLLERAFQARRADESHRARLRVEIGRLRTAIEPLASLKATKRGFELTPHAADTVCVLVPPVDGEHGQVLALMADGEAWSSSALATALGVSARTTQRALEVLAEAGKVESFGRGRACRWVARSVPGFPTSLLLPLVVPES